MWVRTVGSGLAIFWNSSLQPRCSPSNRTLQFSQNCWTGLLHQRGMFALTIPQFQAGGGELTFFLTEGDQGSSLLKPLPGQPSKWLTEQKTISVSSVRLEEFLDANISPEESVDLLKIDAQGADLDVISSAGSYLNPKSIKAIYTEINFVDFYEGQNSYHELFAFLDNAGYRLARLYPRYAHDGWLWAGDSLFIPK